MFESWSFFFRLKGFTFELVGTVGNWVMTNNHIETLPVLALPVLTLPL